VNPAIVGMHLIPYIELDLSRSTKISHLFKPGTRSIFPVVEMYHWYEILVIVSVRACVLVHYLVDYLNVKLSCGI